MFLLHEERFIVFVTSSSLFRLNKHDEDRRDELRTLIAIKDERSTIIQNEKQEYKKMVRKEA